VAQEKFVIQLRGRGEPKAQDFFQIPLGHGLKNQVQLGLVLLALIGT
jgi:hypothetical protein